MTKMLRGGMGDTFTTLRPVVRRVEPVVTPAAVIAARQAMEDRFDAEAAAEAAAIRSHRAMTPARLLTQGRAG